MVVIICFLLAILLGFGIYKIIPKNYDNNYKQGEQFIIDQLAYKIEDSIITNLNYNGEIIGENSYYVVVKLYIENLSKEEIMIDFNAFRLKTKDKYIYPTTDQGNNFIDYAVNNIGNNIKGESKDIYSLIYKIDKKDKNDNYKIKVNNGSIIENDKRVNIFNYITITPIVINEINLESKVKVGEKIEFTNSNLSNSVITLSNPRITEKYTYNYEYCIYNECSTYKDIINLDYTKNDKILVVLDYEYSLDSNVPFAKYSTSINKFTNSFIKLRYLEEDKYIYTSVRDITPKNLKNKIVLETSNKIKNNKDIDVSIIIRNKEYIIDIN